jgi:hypothetical protein
MHLSDDQGRCPLARENPDFVFAHGLSP